MPALPGEWADYAVVTNAMRSLLSRRAWNRRSPRLWCPVVALVLAAGLLLPSGAHQHAVSVKPHPGASLRVVSLNIATTDSATALAEEIRSQGLDDADIYLLQEVVGETDEQSRVAEELLSRSGMQVFYRAAFEISPGRMYGLAIVSRLPLRSPRVISLPRNNLNLRSRVRIAQAATVDTPFGPVSVMNTHLDTRINLPRRLEQVQPIVEHAVSGNLPAIVGGDFNTNPHYWLLHLVPLPFVQRQGEWLREHMAGHGFESAIGGRQATHDFLGMQLDWIFVRKLRAVGTRIVPMRHSDHHAVVTTIAPQAER